jgi:GT2 family glycosyltransferase
MDISIIIVNYRSWKPLQKCLESILAIQYNEFMVEVIVVDNYSNDEEFFKYKNKFKDFIFIQNTKNLGYSNGCNIGAKRAQGDFLLFLNPDTILSKNTLETLYTVNKKNPEIGILSCLQKNNNDKFYNYNKNFPSLFGVFSSVLFVKKDLNEFNTGNKNLLFYTDWTTGSLIFISRIWFDKVNGWNEDYWLYFEDVDICKKIKKQDGIIAVTNQTTILHKHGGSSRINFETECISKSEVVISKHVYIRNNFSPLLQMPAHLLLILTILTKKAFLSLVSFVFYYNLKLKTNRIILLKLFYYYTNAIYNKTWLSKRSVNYPT